MVLSRAVIRANAGSSTGLLLVPLSADDDAGGVVMGALMSNSGMSILAIFARHVREGVSADVAAAAALTAASLASTVAEVSELTGGVRTGDDMILMASMSESALC